MKKTLIFLLSAILLGGCAAKPAPAPVPAGTPEPVAAHCRAVAEEALHLAEGFPRFFGRSMCAGHGYMV